MVDSVTIEAADPCQVDSLDWTSIEAVNDQLQATNKNADCLEIGSEIQPKGNKEAPAVFQTCSECKKKIACFYRIVRRKDLEVAFVKCTCGSYPLVVKDGRAVARLKTEFDSTQANNGAREQHYNRSVWSTSTALLYCEKTSRLVVEYQWKDLEAGQFDKHSVKLSGIKSSSKTADIVVDKKTISFLLKDGTLTLGGFTYKISGKF